VTKYKQLTSVVAFSAKILMTPIAAKLFIGSTKVRGCNDGTEVLYYRAKLGGN